MTCLECNQYPVLSSGFVHAKGGMIQQLIHFGKAQILDIFKQESAAHAVKALSANLGNVRSALKNQLTVLVGAVPKVSK